MRTSSTNSSKNNISPQEENVNFLLNNENIIKIDLSTNLQKEFNNLKTMKEKQNYVRQFLCANLIGRTFRMSDGLIISIQKKI